MSDPISTPPNGQNPITLSIRPAKKSVSLVVAVAVGVVGLGAGAGIGRATAPQATAVGRFGDGNFPRPNMSGMPGANGQPGMGGFGGMRDGNGPSLSGTVKSVNGTSVTMALQNGKTVTFNLGSSTKVNKNVAAQPADVAAGATVSVQVQGADLGKLFQGTTDNIDLGDVTAVTVK